MNTEHYIPIKQICELYHIDLTFINELKETGLVELQLFDTMECIHQNHLAKIEQMIRLHYELGVNPEGIDVINHLLQRISNLQEEIFLIRNKLRLYED